MNKKRGKIFIITGPSGAGKTEIAKRILKKKNLHIRRVVTCTTRPPRPGEKNGRDYFFLSKKEFLSNIRNGRMFEYAEVYGNYYGSRKKDVEKLLNTGNNVLFVTDVQGAISLKKADKNCAGIFLKAESIEELEKRLLNRKTDSNKIINNRIKAALSEIKLVSKFDYEVDNPHGRIDEAVMGVADIILGRRKKLFLVEGLPGTGKSSLMDELKKKYTIIYEFHTKRKKITKQFGAFKKGKRIAIGNKQAKILEDKLEHIILHSRFLDPNKESIKLALLKEKIKECLALKEDQIFKEGFFGCLIDENSEKFLSELKIMLKNVDLIFFLTLSDKNLYKRQIKRLAGRKGEYDDRTSNTRHKIFMSQFNKVTKNKKIIYLDARPSPKIIAKNLFKKLEM